MTPREVVKFAEENGVKMVDYKFLDFVGIWQHFTQPMSEFSEDTFEEGIGFDGSSIRGWQPIHNSDMLIMPDPSTAQIDPFVKATTLSLICNIIDPITKEGYSRDPLGRPYTTLGYQNGPGAQSAALDNDAGPIHQQQQDLGARGEAAGRPDLTHVDTTNPDFLQEAAVPFTYETHSGEDVPVYATGPGADLFHGVQEQHYLYHAMVEALGWNRRSLVEPKPR